MLKEIEAVPADIQRVADLSNRPNYPLTYGGDGLSATALKARFDALPLAVRDKVNQLIAMLCAHSEEQSGASCIGIAPQSYNEGRVTASSVADLVDALADTGIAQLLMVHTGERICSLQACLQEHTEQLKRREGILWTVQTNSLTLTFPDGQTVDLPFNPQPQAVRTEELVVEDRGSYIVTGLDTVTIRYPFSEIICGSDWLDSMGRYSSQLLTFVDAHTARGNCMFGMCPVPGALCVVNVNDGQALPPTVAIGDDPGVVHLHLSEMDVSMTQALEGVDVEVYVHAGGYKAGDSIAIHAMSYAPFEADVRICAGENGMTVHIPSSLYTTDLPKLEPYSIWDMHMNGGVVRAYKVMHAEEAATSGTAGVQQALEVIANAAY